ncbi:MAG TPA: aminotransferase class I/II-fold pyridoxal phosphate-dependent enzyme [Vicinamibacteria bacterium]|nr:aminotransferase class I/II-fold pyridoxal phosphate-dependent enzyme [Vicinamibacteria bacterium]
MSDGREGAGGPRGLGTTAVHGRGGPGQGPLTTPIVQASTFVFDSSAEMRRYLEGDPDLAFEFYTRYGNPTLRALEEALAALEGAEAGVVFASGMAAMTSAILSVVEAGDEVLASASLYGGTTKFVRDHLPRLGMASRIVPPGDLPRLDAVAGPRSRVVVLESPTNPAVDVVDIAAVARKAHAAGMTVIVDNTFAGPFLQHPLALGADIVMHSLTKSLGGHSDIIGGALVGSATRMHRVRETLKVLGGCLDPHSAFLVLRGLKTLHLRVARQCENALALARHLQGHPKVARILYPGLPEHPGHEVARRQMSAFGGVVGVVLHGGIAAAERFYDGLRLMARAASLGGVETLVSLPVHTSHYGYSEEQLRAAGIDPGLVRISLGVEDAADLVADAEAALAGIPER